MIPTTTRVERHTDEAVNEQIRRRTAQSISYVGRQGHYGISRRLEELDHDDLPSTHTIDERKASRILAAMNR